MVKSSEKNTESKGVSAMKLFRTSLIILSVLLVLLVVIGCNKAAETSAPDTTPIAPEIARTVEDTTTFCALPTTAPVTTAKPIQTVIVDKVDDTPVTVYYPYD